MAAFGHTALERTAGTAFPAEVDALVRVARAAIAGHLCKLDVEPRIDWQECIRLAEMHGLQAMLLQAIRGTATDLPSSVIETLTRNVTEIGGRNLVLGKESIRISRALHDARIGHVVYKGPVLAQMLYGTLATRPSRDIDLIVRQEQAQSAFEVLAALGYADVDKLAPQQRSAAIRFGSEQCFARERIEVDLHWRLAPHVSARGVDEAAMWRRTGSARLFDSDVPTFRAEDLFLALCLHAGEHGWSQISLFCDLGRLLEVTPGFDWDLVRGHLRDANTRRTVDVTLLLLANCFGVQVPPDMLRRELQVELIGARVVSDFWPTPERSAHKETDLGWIRKRCRGERFSDRIRWISGVLLTPTLADFQAFGLPDSLHFLYRPLRVLRLAFRRG